MAGSSPTSSIELTRLDGALRIEGFVDGGSGEVKATLIIAHQGSGGTMNTRQGRAVQLSENQRVSVSSTQINFGPTSDLVVELIVEDDTGVISRSVTHITPQS